MYVTPITYKRKGQSLHIYTNISMLCWCICIDMFYKIFLFYLFDSKQIELNYYIPRESFKFSYASIYF